MHLTPLKNALDSTKEVFPSPISLPGRSCRALGDRANLTIASKYLGWMKGIMIARRVSVMGKRWTPLVSGSIVLFGLGRLVKEKRWRALGTFCAANIGGQLSVRGGCPSWRLSAASAAYGIGRVVPSWRVPLLLAAGMLEARTALRSGRSTKEGLTAFICGLAGAMLAVAVAEEAADRRPRPSSGRQVAMVINIHSGSPHLARRAVRALRRQPVEIVSIVRTTGAGLGRALTESLASLPAEGILVAAGGDGTVGRAAFEAGNAGRTLAIVPTGTGNDVARSLGLPLSPEEAIDLVATADPVPMDLGTTGSGSFAHAATYGMTADFAQRIRDIRGWRRPLVYPLRAWQAWRGRTPLSIRILVDGQPLVAPSAAFQVAIVNAPRLGGRIGIPLPGSAVDDGLLETIVSYRGALRLTAAGLIRLMFGNVDQRRGATIAAGKVVEVRSDTPLIVSLDGEPCVTSTTSLRASVRTPGCYVLRSRQFTRHR